jgi:hypothetical protein
MMFLNLLWPAILFVSSDRSRTVSAFTPQPSPGGERIAKLGRAAA